MFRGHLDHATRRWIYGWAFDEAHPDQPAIVEVRINGDLVARLTANLARSDLEAAIGHARHGFELFLPGLCALHRQVISARIAGSDKDLENSPVVIERATAFDAEVESSLAQLIASGDVPTLERAAVTLSEMIEATLDRRAALQTHREARDLRYRWFAARGAALQPQIAPKRALFVLPERDQATDAVHFFAANHAQSLRALGFEVCVAMASLADLAPSESAHLHALGVETACRPFVASIEELLWRQRHGLEVVLLVGPDVERRYRPLAQAHVSRARILTLSSEGRVEDEAGAGEASGASWSVELRPHGRSFETRRGLLLLDGPDELQPVVRELLDDAIERARGAISDLLLLRTSSSSDRANAAPLQTARVALTLASSPRACRDVVAAVINGVPSIAPRALVGSLALPPELATCNTAKAGEIASAIVRLHEDAVHHSTIRKRALDHLDLHHAPAAAARAWRAMLRARPSAGQVGFMAVGFMTSARTMALPESMAC